MWKHSIQMGIVCVSTAYLIIYNCFLCLMVWLLFILFFYPKVWSLKQPGIKHLAVFTNYKNGFWLRCGKIKVADQYVSQWHSSEFQQERAALCSVFLPVLAQDAGFALHIFPVVFQGYWQGEHWVLSVKWDADLQDTHKTLHNKKATLSCRWKNCQNHADI